MTYKEIQEILSREPFNFVITTENKTDSSGFLILGSREIVDPYGEVSLSRVDIRLDDLISKTILIMRGIPQFNFFQKEEKQFNNITKIFSFSNYHYMEDGDVRDSLERWSMYFDVYNFYKRLDNIRDDLQLLKLLEYILKFPGYGPTAYNVHVKNMIYEIKKKYNMTLSFKEYSWGM
jgi:hypothetical protein